MTGWIFQNYEMILRSLMTSKLVGLELMIAGSVMQKIYVIR